MYAEKTVVLGVTGGIAAYKAADLVSRLKKLDFNVHVIMTEHAKAFISPLTFQSLSENYVTTDMFEPPKSWDIEHIALAKKADVFVVAPATANVIGKIANGIADDMLTTTIMASGAPKLICPAMNTAMYQNPISAQNRDKLKGLGYHFVDPAAGRLACGDVGLGKLADPEEIVEAIVGLASRDRRFAGKKILVTAGATREAIDPVRFFSNHSSGKMGYAIAREGARRGADVTLVTGPSSLAPPTGVEVVRVESACEMHDAVMERLDRMDLIVKAAAVADYRPAEVLQHKMKKKAGPLSIPMERNPDICEEVGKRKRSDQLLVGFAAETENVEANALHKLRTKNMDLIVANNIGEAGAGFEGDTNIVTLIDRNEKVTRHPRMTKQKVASVLLEEIADKL